MNAHDEVRDAIIAASEFPDPTEHEFFYRHITKAAMDVVVRRLQTAATRERNSGHVAGAQVLDQMIKELRR